MEYQLPKANIAEITLLGTGGGYGESCVIHYGNSRWAVVDSCVNPKTKNSLPLEYLRKLGVNISTDVKYIFCTHWHNDHILGLSRLLDACKEAAFCFGKAINTKQFLFWVSLDYQKIKDEQSISSTSEFVECLKIAERRETRVIQAFPDRILFTDPSSNTSIISLSPSDFVIEQGDKEVSRLIKNYGSPDKKYVINTPNDQSVVLLFEIGYHKALLGADLEVTSDKRKGWLNILDFSTAIKEKKASLFKISHHGSENAYHERIWLELLHENPIAKLTPWNRNKILPDPKMVKIYSDKTSNLYITSPFSKKTKAKKRDPKLAKIIEFFNSKVSEVKFDAGIIQCRIAMDDADANWIVDLDGEGYHINKEII